MAGHAGGMAFVVHLTMEFQAKFSFADPSVQLGEVFLDRGQHAKRPQHPCQNHAFQDRIQIEFHHYTTPSLHLA